MFQRFARTSEQKAFGIEYMNALYGYALMLTRNSVEAEDLVQETYVRALKAQHRLREDSNIKGWFFTILRNIWLNQMRKGKSGKVWVSMLFCSWSRRAMTSQLWRSFAPRLPMNV